VVDVEGAAGRDRAAGAVGDDAGAAVGGRVGDRRAADRGRVRVDDADRAGDAVVLVDGRALRDAHRVGEGGRGGVGDDGGLVDVLRQRPVEVAGAPGTYPRCDSAA